MANNNKKVLISLLVTVAMLLCSIGGIVAFAAASQANNKWSGQEVASAYVWGTELTIPNRTVGDGAKVSHILTYPDGRTSYADSVVLDASGTYELTYTAQAGSKVYSEVHSFVVAPRLYSTDSSKSSVVYGTPENQRPEEQGGDPKQGLIVSLAKGDTLTFNKAIPLDQLNLEDAFVDGFIIPQSEGQSSFSTLKITLTDMENPDIYFTITIKERGQNNDFGRSYVLAGANGQYMACGEGDYFSNEFRRVFINQQGLLIYTPFGGKATITNGNTGDQYVFHPYDDDYPFRFYFDPVSMELWHSSQYFLPGTRDENGKIIQDFSIESSKDNVIRNVTEHMRFITDFDNPEIYASLWSGFTSGYVKLSISADNYNFDLAKFCITSVAGMDVSETSFEITSEPKIVVPNEDTLPEASVGAWYSIPEATATDIYSGTLDCTATVMFNYNSDNPLSAKVSDGRFYVDRPGYYAVIYKATNAMGISSEKVVFIHASKDIKAVNIEFDPATMVTEALTLDFVPYAEAILTNGSGSRSLSIYAKLGNEIIATEGGFRPTKQGDWEIVYTVTDEIGQVSINSYFVHVSAKDEYTLTDSIVLPKVIVSGGKYTLPEIYAKRTVNDNVEKILCTVTVTTGGKTATYKAGETVAISVAERGDEVTFKYLCGEQELYSETVPSVMPYENGSLDYTQLFVGTNAVANKSADGCIVTLSGTEASFFYANPIVPEDIKLVLRCLQGTANYNEIVVTLTDAADYSNSVEAKFIVVDGIVTMVVGEKQYKTGYVFNASTFDLPINFKNNKFVWDVTAFDIEKTVSGASFEGFKSDKVYLQIDVKNIKGDAEICVDSIRAYNFDEQTADYSRPYFSHPGLANNVNHGDVVTLPVIVVGDLISPSLKTTLTVKAPDGSIVTDVNGLRLENVDPFCEYVFTAEQIGRYKATYSIEKDNEFGVKSRSEDYTCSVNILDIIAPEIEITSGYTKEATVGDVVILPDFTVTDNHSPAEDITIYVYLVSPTGQYTMVNGNSVRVDGTGIYEWHIYSYDKAGNLAVEKLQVNVR